MPKKYDDIDFEIRFYENLLDKMPNFPEALAALGDVYTRRGLIEKGLHVDKRLAVLKPEDPTVLYNLACSFSLTGDINMALRTIKKAVNCGYDDFEHLAQDDDLTNLHQDARFRRYFARLIKKLQSTDS